VTPPDASFDLHLPAGTAMLFEKRIAAIPEGKRTGWRYHRIASGETLASVAHSYHVTEAALAAANQLGDSDNIAGVEALVVPAAPSAAPKSSSSSLSSSSSSTASHARLYTVHRGDTLVTIADRFGVSLNQLRQWNKIRGTKVASGRKLRVSDSDNAPRTAAVSGRHRRGRSSADADRQEAAPAKDVSTKSATAGRHGRRAKSAGKSAEKKAPEQSVKPSDEDRKSGAANAKKSHARSHTSGSRHRGKK
jgi:membrane-bound lytic murein transglycosylase D